jgi:hypothetical protein
MAKNGRNNGKKPTTGLSEKERISKEEARRRSNANLRPFQPGQSGHPEGRPRGKTPSETLRAFATAEYGAYGPEQLKEIQKRMPEPWRSMPVEKITLQEFIAFIQLMQALRPAGWKDRSDFYDRVEGRPTIKIAGPDGGPLQVERTVNIKKFSTEQLRLWRELMSIGMDGNSEGDG